MNKANIASFIIVFFCSVSSSFLYADTVRLGMSAPFSGPTKELGIELHKGAVSYFDQYNKQPENQDKAIELIRYDDGYEPNRTIANTRQLITQDKVFSLFSYVGTPTSKAILPLLERYQMLYFSPFTGAEFLRTPFNKQFFNVRGSYYQEAEILVEHFTKQLPLKKVAIFFQADAFGIAASKGYINALSQKFITDIIQVRYKRNSNDIAAAVKVLQDEQPDVILCVGTYQPVASLANALRAKNLTMPIGVLSFAGAEALVSQLKNPKNIYMSTVVPNPKQSKLAIVEQYRQAMQGKQLTHESLEGYINAALFSEIIKQVSLPITQEKFIEVAESHTFDLGGITVSYSSENHAANILPTLNKVTKKGLIEIN
ncbi:ABC transporter substrate-binding protein [Colwellia sp. MEBiC06753]